MSKSIAQRCIEAEDPLQSARCRSGYKGHPRKDVLRYHFEDNSYLDFQMSYTPIEAGRIFEGSNVGGGS